VNEGRAKEKKEIEWKEEGQERNKYGRKKKERYVTETIIKES